MTEQAGSGDLIPLKEFAHRLDRNVEATRRRFGDIAVRRDGRIYFKVSDLERLLKEEVREDDAEFEIARNWLAKVLEVDPRTLDKRLSHLKSRVVEGQRRYRKVDIDPILKEVHDNELLTEIEVTRLFRGHHIWQLHLLRDFPKMFRDPADKIPRHDHEGPMGLLWKRKTIRRLASELANEPSAVLADNSIAFFEAAGDPAASPYLQLDPVREHYDRIEKRLESIAEHEAAFRQKKKARKERLRL